ncbi:hypothetical protein O1L60_30215 [Streptomyces diastatochromogenes]|nr:hypothetical protein [Streptomyces diastatochromogenes]
MSTRAYGRTPWPWAAAAILLFWQTWFLFHVYATENSAVRWDCDSEGCGTNDLAGPAIPFGVISGLAAAVFAGPLLGLGGAGLAALLAAFGLLVRREDDHALLAAYGLAAFGVALVMAARSGPCAAGRRRKRRTDPAPAWPARRRRPAARARRTGHPARGRPGDPRGDRVRAGRPRRTALDHDARPQRHRRPARRARLGPAEPPPRRGPRTRPRRGAAHAPARLNALTTRGTAFVYDLTVRPERAPRTASRSSTPRPQDVRVHRAALVRHDPAAPGTSTSPGPAPAALARARAAAARAEAPATAPRLWTPPRAPRSCWPPGCSRRS